jgi:hypothetical protein
MSHWAPWLLDKDGNVIQNWEELGWVTPIKMDVSKLHPNSEIFIALENYLEAKGRVNLTEFTRGNTVSIREEGKYYGRRGKIAGISDRFAMILVAKTVEVIALDQLVRVKRRQKRRSHRTQLAAA